MWLYENESDDLRLHRLLALISSIQFLKKQKNFGILNLFKFVEADIQDITTRIQALFLELRWMKLHEIRQVCWV